MNKHFSLIGLLIISNLCIAQQDTSEVSTSGQSRESAAVDPTAAQWSLQFAAEYKGDYQDDKIAEGVTRPEGGQGFYQFRFVAPIEKSDKLPITLLPRLTLRYVQNAAGDYGFGQSDIFILGIAQQWSSGRWGLGPQINFPATANPGGFGNPNWGLGFAAAVTQRAFSDKLFMALLLQQAWTQDQNGDTKPTSLGINPSFVVQLGKGFYVGNGDFVISYNWDTGGWLIPIRARFGKTWVRPSNTINAYIEAGTTNPSKDWHGPAANTNIRVNFQWQIPVN